MRFRTINKYDLLVDLMLIAGLLLACNMLLAPYDLGWFDWNPSPYLLLPILMGSRYGLTGGVFAGAVAVLLSLWGRHFQVNAPLIDIVRSHYYPFSMHLAIGALCGELHAVLNQKHLQLTALNENLQTRLKKLDGDLTYLREAKDELERRLATRDTEACTLDTEIRRLYQTEGEELYQNILWMLARHGRFTDAALYLNESGPSWRRKALHGNPEHLPLEIQPAQWPIVALALERKTVVTIPELWEKGYCDTKEHLLAQPLLDSRDQPLALLLVSGMQFMSFNRKTVRLVSVISQWASGVIEIKNQGAGMCRWLDRQRNQRIFHEAFFRRQAELAFASYQGHQLASTVVGFYLPETASERQSELERLIVAMTRTGDFPSVLAGKRANVLVLLPLTSERGAAIFLQRVLDYCQKDAVLGPLIEARTTTFENIDNIDELWRKLEA